MTEPTNTGGPAFPRSAGDYNGTKNGNGAQPGMTLRQYAAIKLQVPDSGTDWLDAMILQAKRDEFAANAMQGMFASDTQEWNGYGSWDHRATVAYVMADAMLEARKQ